MSSSSNTAQKTFELLNEVRSLDPNDEIFLYDVEEQKKLVKAAPWKKEYASSPLLIYALRRSNIILDELLVPQDMSRIVLTTLIE